MLRFFYQNKLRYEKGQLAPFFIVILVILIIMALVTVNLSKVAFIKTDSSNAADAGALAAGSMMANIFNVEASMNSQMETWYLEFVASTGVEFAINTVYISLAMAQACTTPCTAVASLTKFNYGVGALMLTVGAFTAGQYTYYLSMRKMGEEGHDSAVQAGHKFAFMNSGIGQKLKGGSPPEEVTEEEKKNNYRDTFSKFLDKTVEYNKKYTYPWIDGQEREHSVESSVDIDDVDDFEVHVTVEPWPAVESLLATALALSIAAQTPLGIACGCYDCCMSCSSYAQIAACACMEMGCAIAMPLMIGALAAMAAAEAGLAPGYTLKNPAEVFILCWVDDIDHNRLVRVDTLQKHGGADLGLWQSKYPDTESYSTVSFKGRGKIHPPKLNHDASIIETDK